MNTTTKFYVGIDVSKQWFDASLLVVENGAKKPMQTQQFDNTKTGLNEFKKWLNNDAHFAKENCFIVIENTGVYHRQIASFCEAEKLFLHIGNAAHLKWSMGITRGKNDAVDSERLCTYCYKHIEDIKATPVLSPELQQLKDLHTMRNLLIANKGAQERYLKELKESKSANDMKQMERIANDAIEGIKKSIEKINIAMQNIVLNDNEIKANFDLLLSVPGVGKVIAMYLICCTYNFNNNKSGKELASYAGVVPFGHSSGSSIKGRNKVHKMSNKELKALLHLAALTCIKYYPEFKEYYDRKKAEGKHSNAVINALKNKILLRVAAVIKSKTKYVDNHKIAA